LRNIQ